MLLSPAILSVTAPHPCGLAFSSDRPAVGGMPFLQVFGGDHMQNKDF